MLLVILLLCGRCVVGAGWRGSPLMCCHSRRKVLQGNTRQPVGSYGEGQGFPRLKSRGQEDHLSPG